MSNRCTDIGKFALLVLMLAVSGSAYGIEKEPFQMVEDYGCEPLLGCTLQYYYYIPCPTFSWFWGFSGWNCGDIIGKFATLGDGPTGLNTACDPTACYNLTGISFIDFAGYGTVYPGLFTVEFDVFCSDEEGCPIGPSIWNSGPVETSAGWNDVIFDPPPSLPQCFSDPGPPPSYPRILVTATHTGADCTYPEWGMDNISSPFYDGCQMHDLGSLPVLYPRPYVSHYPTMHSGYYGVDFEHCPPLWLLDGADTTRDGSTYGYLELAWKFRFAQVVCENFIRGDDDGDGELTISDPILSLCAQFADCDLTCLDASDVDDNGEVNISDCIYSLEAQFASGPPPPPPFPQCGYDPVEDGLGCTCHPHCMFCGSPTLVPDGVLRLPSYNGRGSMLSDGDAPDPVIAHRTDRGGEALSCKAGLDVLPNPSTGTVSITYRIPAEGHLKLLIHNLHGQVVRTLADRMELSGSRSQTWDGTNDQGQQVPPGIYFCLVLTGKDRISKKLVISR